VFPERFTVSAQTTPNNPLATPAFPTFFFCFFGYRTVCTPLFYFRPTPPPPIYDFFPFPARRRFPGSLFLFPSPRALAIPFDNIIVLFFSLLLVDDESAASWEKPQPHFCPLFFTEDRSKVRTVLLFFAHTDFPGLFFPPFSFQFFWPSRMPLTSFPPLPLLSHPFFSAPGSASKIPGSRTLMVHRPARSFRPFCVKIISLYLALDLRFLRPRLRCTHFLLLIRPLCSFLYFCPSCRLPIT